MTKTMTLTTIKGTKVETTINVVRAYELTTNYADGYNVASKKFVEITKTSTKIANITVYGDFTTNLYRCTPAGTTAQVMDTIKKAQINLDAEQFAIYSATLSQMITDAEATNDCKDYRAMEAKRNAEEDAYNRNYARTNRAMNY